MKNEITTSNNNQLLNYDNLKDIEKHIETYKKYLNIPNATKEDIAFFSQYCQRTQLDPVSRQIYAISYYEKKSGRQRMQVLLSIDGYRIIAQRTGEFEGVETFWCGADGVWKDVWLDKKYPSASKVVVYKKGGNKGISAVALFEEYANLDSPIWKKMPALMIAKCAESLALRKAFPSALSGLYTTEEMSNSEISQVSNNQNVIDTQAIDNSQYNIENDTYMINDEYQYQIVPSGANKGRLWKDLNIDTLNKAYDYYVNSNIATKDSYINAIIEAIESKELEIENQQKENNEKKEVADVKVSEDENPFDVNEEDYKDWDGSIGGNSVDGNNYKGKIDDNEEVLF